MGWLELQMDAVQPAIARNIEIFEQVGQGEFATVGPAHQVFKGRLSPGSGFVAVKAVHAQKLSANPHLRALLDAEVRVLGAISHKNIIRLLDCVATDKEVDLIYEFCEQGDLRAALQSRLFEEPEALAVLHDLAEALVCLKAAGIVHRDLKPENVLISNGIAKLADFGLCKDLNGPAETQLAHIGSYAFMAPETICSFEYSSATDVYAAGILMYPRLTRFEILTGVLPFDKKNLLELVEQKRAFRVGPGSIPNVSPGLCRLVDCMAAFDPAARPSPEELLAAVKRLMSGVFVGE